MTKLHTVEQVAEWLGCSDDAVRQHIKTGELIAINIGRGKVRRCLRIPDDELKAFLQRRTLEPAGPTRRQTPKVTKDWL
jgi:excisionase family DNA binding protein